MKSYSKVFLIFSSLLLSLLSFSQEKKEIIFNNGGTFSKDEIKYPGASIFQKDINQVEFEHQGAIMWCDLAVFYKEQNKIKAFGNVIFKQGDSITMTSDYVEYKGDIKQAMARINVILKNGGTTLKTDTLYLDRTVQEAYYDSFGTVKDSVNTLTSEKGRYFMELKKVQFTEDVTILNPKYTLESKQLDYYTGSKNAYMYGPSTITGKDYKMYCERGFYDTTLENGYGIKNTRIDYNGRIITGDSLYFNKAQNFASATNNIKITDTVNKGIIRGHYAEIFKLKDSVFITKRAVAINLVEKDSMYIHGDTLMVTGKPKKRIIRAFRAARLYKTDLSAKCDSLHFNQETGLTQLITKVPENTPEKNIPKFYPILWSGDNQMTGENIHLISNPETEQLDSLKVFQKAFIIAKDTLAESNFNQVKGKFLYGQFIKNELEIIDIDKNTEVIYYLYNDKNELIGINKTIPSSIRLTLKKNKIKDITFFTDVEGEIHPEENLHINERKLSGFVWRGEERIKSKDDIFDEDDNNIKLVVIRGITNPIDIDAEEAERSGKKTIKKPEPPKRFNGIKPKNPTRKLKKAQ